MRWLGDSNNEFIEAPLPNEVSDRTMFTPGPFTVTLEPQFAYADPAVIEKTREQIYADFRLMMDNARHIERRETIEPLPTYEEISAALDRAANPTPSDRAAAMLNGERVVRLTPRA